MEAHLNELIEKIKNDGVKTAEDQAAVIVAEAEKKAAQLVNQAEKDAEALLSKAKNDALKFEISGKDALSQASRNLLIELRKSIESQLGSLVDEESTKALSGKSLQDSIVSVMENWSKNDSSELELLIPENELKAIEKDLLSKLSAQMKAGLEIKPFADIQSGFRISSKDGKMFYDFSDEELSRMVSRYLNQRIQDIMTV